MESTGKLTNESDGYGRDTSIRIERPQVELGESNRWVDGLGRILDIRKHCWIARTLHRHLCPLLSDHTLCLGHELTDDGKHEIKPVGIISRILVDQLTRSQRIVTCVAVGDSGVQ